MCGLGHSVEYILFYIDWFVAMGGWMTTELGMGFRHEWTIVIGAE